LPWRPRIAEAGDAAFLTLLTTLTAIEPAKMATLASSLPRYPDVDHMNVPREINADAAKFPQKSNPGASRSNR
jgi:hypothetical protein